MLRIGSLILALCLGGCASSALNADQRTAIRRVSIGEVKMPEKPTIFGESTAAGFLLGGPLGVALVNAGNDLPALYAKKLEASKVDVAALVRSDLANALRQQGFEVVAAGQPADARVVPHVLQYGLTGNVFATPPVRVPQLWLRIDLKKPASEEQIWWNFASVHVMPDILEKLEARRIDDYLQDGELLRTQVQKASKLVAEAAVSKL